MYKKKISLTILCIFLVSCAYAAGSLLLESSSDSVSSGEAVTFSAMLGETPGYFSADLDVEYDSDYLIYKDFSVVGTASKDFGSINVQDDGNTISTSMSGANNNIGADGAPIIEFNFEAKEVTENTDTTVSITSAIIGSFLGEQTISTLGEKIITILGLPDLVVQEILITDSQGNTLIAGSEISEGDEITIASTIENIGGSDIDTAFTTGVYASMSSENLFETDEIDILNYNTNSLVVDDLLSLVPATDWVVDNSVVYEDDTVDICIYVDSGKVITESNEASATFFKSIFGDTSQSNIECVTLTVLNVPVCGDNLKEGAEVCDDSTTGVECTPTYGNECTYCKADCTEVITKVGSYCGDNTPDSPEEECDDGARVDGDGCSSTCQIEVADPVCGDGIVNGDDECDGLDLNGETCASLPGFDYGNLVCDANCDFDVSGCAMYDCTEAADCTDEDLCTGAETCDLSTHTCVAGTALTCDDGVDCTEDSCDKLLGCVTDLVHSACDDIVDCTIDTCSDSGCLSTPETCICEAGDSAGVCEDGNPCTTDSCGADFTCSNVNVADETVCDDTLSCTNSDMCMDGVCGGTPAEDDGISCTVDVCSESDGVVQNTPDASLCIDDGDAGTKTVCSLSAGCVNEPITLCLAGDNFCPSGCSALVGDASYDVDCPIVCGNSKIESSTDHIIFVSTTSTGGAITYEELTGIDAADAICQANAESAGLAGTFVALLSTSTVDAKDRINDAQFYNIENQLVADSKSDLFDGNIDAKVYDLSKQDGTAVKTATNADGTFNADYDDCQGWTYAGDDEDILLGVNSKLDRDWLGYNAYDYCSRVIPIYCVQDVLGEACDDGNAESGDGCSDTCAIEDDYECSGTPSRCVMDLAVQLCGDGGVDLAIDEECDDGNTADGDGCSSKCKVEQQTNSVCGNDVKEVGEECDDGNVLSSDGCSNECVEEFCGDETVQNGLGEECEDMNSIDTDACKNDCTWNLDYVPDTACSDTDGHLSIEEQYMVKGTVTDTNAEITIVLTDVCTISSAPEANETWPKEYIQEQFCEEDQQKSILFKCTNGCAEGACMADPYVVDDDPETPEDTTPTPAPASSGGSSGGGGGFVFTRYTTHFQCDDNTDNDGDGKIDLDDPDCSSLVDDSERTSYNPQPAKTTNFVKQVLQPKEPAKTVKTVKPQNLCGNGNCEVTETSDSCPSDCKTVSFTWLVVLLAAIGGGGVIYLKRDELSTFSFDDLRYGSSIDEVKDKLREIIPKKSEDLSLDKPTTLPIRPTQKPKSISQRPLSVLPRKIRVQPMLPTQQISPRMIAYIRSVRVRGYTDEEIRQMLLKYHWSVSKINQALGAA
jgi:cysteine-rich repeat protein